MNIRSALGKHIAPWRFILFFVVLIAGWAIAGPRLSLAKAGLVGFDVAAMAFLVSCFWLFNDKVDDMRTIAKETDANRVVLLVLTFILTVVILAAVVAELGKSGKLEPFDKALVATSLVLVWLFANAVYALHYCHLFYTRDDGGNDSGDSISPGRRNP